MSARRVAHGIAANTVQFTSTIGIQLISVPILVHLWGLSQYGVWLILSTIPSYLMLSNFGVSLVAANEMAGLLAAGERERARAIYSSNFWTVAAISALLIAGGVGVAALIPVQAMPAAEHVAPGEMRLALVALMSFGAVAINTELAMVPYRATGRFARGVYINSTIMVLERLALLAAAPFGFGIAALAMLGVRLIGLSYMFASSLMSNPDLRPRLSEASLRDAKRLLGLGFGMMLFTFAMTLNLQGPILVLGAILPPAAVAVFSTTRTLTRFGFQAAAAISTSVMAEFAIVSGSGDDDRRRRLFAFNFIVTAVLVAGMLLILSLFGEDLIYWWLVGTARPEFLLIILLGTGSALQGLWQSTANMLMAVNRQYAFTPVFLAVVVVMVGAGAVAAQRWGLAGMAAVILVAEMVVCVWVYRQAARLGIGTLREAWGTGTEVFGLWMARRRAAGVDR